jgi:hypothetical protein
MALLRDMVHTYTEGAGEPQLPLPQLHRRAGALFSVYVSLLRENGLQLPRTSEAVPPPEHVCRALLAKAREEGKLVTVVARNSSLVLHEQRTMMLCGPRDLTRICVVVIR